MKAKKTISVVIPLYNKRSAIIRTMMSIVRQKRLPDEIIIVDDGSTDGSLEKAYEVLRSDEMKGMSYKVIEQDNSGVSVARNKGVDTSTSEFIAFLDADDEWMPEHLAEIEALAKAVPNAGILSTRHARMNSFGEPVAEPSALHHGFFGEVHNGLNIYRMGYGVLHTSSVAVSRAAWQRSGGFPAGERKSQDIHLWLRMLLSEAFAHSDRVTSIWHEEDTGVARRSGFVPAHFKYFLGSAPGRKYMLDPDLQRFIQENLIKHVAGHKVRRDDEVVLELLSLSRHLPLFAQFKVRAISVVPRRALLAIATLKRKLLK